MAMMTRINKHGETNPLPLPETAHLTPEQKAEYTFLLTKDDDEQFLIAESAAVQEIPLLAHLEVGQQYMILGS
jgi:hypothetical protein